MRRARRAARDLLRHVVVDGADLEHLPVAENCYPVADGIECIEVVRNQEHCQPERTLERQGQLIERRRPDQADAIKALAVVPNPLTVDAVSRALNIAEGRMVI